MTQRIGHWQKHESGLLRFASQLKGRKREGCVMVKALIFVRTAQCRGRECECKDGRAKPTCLATSWGLSQIRNEADKNQILLGGIMLFLSCQCPSLYNSLTTRCDTASLHPGESLGHSHAVLKVFIPSDEANLAHLCWHERQMSCLRRCHTSSKYPQTHFWGLPPEHMVHSAVTVYNSPTWAFSSKPDN